MARNTIVSYFFYFILFNIFRCLGNRISFVPKVQAYVKSKCLDQMCICEGWSRYIDGISLDQVCNGVG